MAVRDPIDVLKTHKNLKTPGIEFLARRQHSKHPMANRKNNVESAT
jgi:hypothetical protein